MRKKKKVLIFSSGGYEYKGHRDYIVEGDPSVPEEIHKTKRQAIAAAKQMARETGVEASVLTCVDGYVDDFATHYDVTPEGKVTERK